MTGWQEPHEAAQLRDVALGAALAALPQPELPASMGARLRATLEAERLRRRRRRSAGVIALAAALATLALGAAALAGAFDSDSPAPWPEPPLAAASAYPTNAAGLTYGPEKPLVEAPDLMRVAATNGRLGYAYRTDLEVPMPASPAEAIASNERSLRGYTIPVYESDGTTQIGVFQIGGPGSTSVLRQADGTTITKEADEEGTIITTTVAADGMTTIETKALDGTVRTKTLTPAEARRLKVAADAAPSPAASHAPDMPRAWLGERMTELARKAGDAHARAWWELQIRYYLKAVEGGRAPTSPYQKWAIVWLVVMHGDFPGGGWRYWLLDRDSHNVLSQGQSERPFDTSRIPPLQGPVSLGKR